MIKERIHTDPLTIQKFVEGDQQAFAQVFHQYKQMVFGVAWTFTENTHLSEEITQDVFILLWKYRLKLREVNDLGNYLYVMAKNRALKTIKTAVRELKEDFTIMTTDKLWEPDHTQQINEREMERLLTQALALLTPQQQAVFRLSRLENKSREEIAENLGISKATVSVHLTIGIRTVRAFLLQRLSIVAAIITLARIF